MKRYLQHLRADIEWATRQAPNPAGEKWFPFDFDDETGQETEALHTVRLCQLFQIQPEAFPPEHFLSDRQVQALLRSISKLWKAWNFYWEMPLSLSDRKKYKAMVRAMGVEPVRWDALNGGEVPICRFETGGYCPFEPEGSKCQCRKTEESAAKWEKLIESEGFDPDFEQFVSEEHEIMILELQRIYGEEWEQFADADLLYYAYAEGDVNYQPREEESEDDFLFDAFFDDLEDGLDDEAPAKKDDDS